MVRKLCLIIVMMIFATACGKKNLSTEFDSRAPSSDGNTPAEAGGGNTGQGPAPTPTPPSGPLAPPATVFKMAPTVYTLAHDKAQFWEGCDVEALARGGYNSDTVCGRAYLHPRLSDHLNKFFFTCATRATRKAALADPAKIFIKHFGSYNDRPARGSSRLSMHAYARALDLVNLNIIHKDGQVTRISTNVKDYKGAVKTFYDEFRDCWKESMPKTCGPGDSEWEGSIGIPGSKLGGNDLHNDHIHLSLPLCAG